MSRSTFHKRMQKEGKAWQRVVREEAASRYEGKEWWEGVDLSLSNATVKPVERKIAEKIIKEYEWLGTLPAGVSWFFGLFFEWACGGVTCWCSGKGGGANIYAHREFGIDPEELAYLARGACTHWAPPNANSKLIAYSLRLMKERGFKVAIAYADTDAGEIGTVYQATNWLCVGRTATTTQFIHPDTGRVYDQKVIADFRRRNNLKGRERWKETKKRFLRRGWKTQKSNPKYKYIYIMAEGREHDHIYRRIAEQIIPYPKRQQIFG